MNQDYIRTAKGKGARDGRVIFGHALRNALIPVITQLGMNFAGLLGGAMITEIVFGLPGFGNAIVAAINGKGCSADHVFSSVPVNHIYGDHAGCRFDLCFCGPSN